MLLSLGNQQHLDLHPVIKTMKDPDKIALEDHLEFPQVKLSLQEHLEDRAT